MEKKYLDKALAMAMEDFDTFCRYAGVDKKQLAVCIERSRGLSLSQIGIKLNLAKSSVQRITDRCEG